MEFVYVLKCEQRIHAIHRTKEKAIEDLIKVISFHYNEDVKINGNKAHYSKEEILNRLEEIALSEDKGANLNVHCAYGKYSIIKMILED